MVSDGHARNLLIPQGLAEIATAEALENLRRRQIAIAAKEAKKRSSYQTLAEKLKALQLRFVLKMGEKGQVFGSVSGQDIVEKLAEQGIKIEKKWIELDEPIKTTGEHTVKLKFPHHIRTEMKIIIEPKES